jgi:hypothetical protein
MAGDCPKGGNHDYRYAGESGGYVTHRCHKCGDTITRKQGRRSARLAVLALLLALPVLLVAVWSGTAGAATPPAPRSNPFVFTMHATGRNGLVIRDDAGPVPDNPFLITDHNNAPMFWINLFGAFSGGEPVCVTGLRLQPVACLGGPLGSYGGRPVVVLYGPGGGHVTLTMADIRFLHRQERAAGRPG